VEIATEESGKYKLVTLTGSIDWENARQIDTLVQQVIDDGFVHIVFNLEGVEFICSGGVGALMYNLNKVKRLGGGLYLISSNDYINYIFETLRFDVVFEGYLFGSYDEFREKVMDTEE
jgi:anti-anti-sigma factor